MMIDKFFHGLELTERAISPLIEVFEKPAIKKRTQQNFQPIFIIGAPRSGSTLLYQILTNQLDLLYINNLVHIFNHNLYFGFWLSEKFLKTPHNCFSSRFGNTFHCGLKGPSECGQFWYRWLPKKHFIGHNELNKTEKTEISQNIYAVMNRFNKPLLFKNLTLSLRMRMISEIAPNAKFIFVKRDPLYNSQSIIKAREKHNGVENWWSLEPPNKKELEKLSPEEQVVKQVYYVEKQISMDAKLFPKDNLITINYEDLCSDYGKELARIKNFLDVKYNKGTKKSKINISATMDLKLDEKTIHKLKTIIKKLDWKNYID